LIPHYHTNITQEKIMQIQVHTDNHIEGSDELINKVESALEQSLGRFAERITRLEVHLSDENSAQKSFGNAMRCRIEARLASRDPVVVTADGEIIEQAISGSTKKLVRLLDSTLGRLDNPRG
jgi:ribosome-associated translation inhibitor RaiA